MLLKVFLLGALGLSTFAARAGADGFAIYLNNKLITKQWVSQSLSLKSLQLGKANADDKLTIYYTQCHPDGKKDKARSITVRDEKGNIIREWKFTGDNNSAMVIPVKELLQLEKAGANGSLQLYYAAEDRPRAQALAGLQIG